MCVCARRVERATGRMRYMQITYTQRVSCVCVRTQTTDDSRMCVRVFYLRPKSPDTIPVQLFRPSALASWPHWHNLSALSVRSVDQGRLWQLNMPASTINC